jgi:hypothetical protein
MRFSTTASACLFTFITTASANVVGTSCTVTHNSGNGGNQFSINWADIPAGAIANFCNNFGTDVAQGISAAGMQGKGSPLCEVNTNGVDSAFTQLTINKQPCANQLEVIQGAVAKAAGLAVTGPSCNLGVC